MDFNQIDGFLLSALREDIGAGDVTTECCVPESAVSNGVFRAKADGVVCGLAVAARVFALTDARVVFSPSVKDGDAVKTGGVIADIFGPSRSILTAERVALNVLQHMSGVATAARLASEAVAGTRARIVDTRKTTPGMRVLEKYAVRTGGAYNHRFGLSDGVLIKDNHIKAAGGITNAVECARKAVSHTLKIEVECETRENVKEALACGADIIMLDNMTAEEMRENVALIAGRAIIEASGNMGSRIPLREVAETGADFISVGSMTHSAAALDISLKLN
ncbi:MAG: carboxylating nicotinate-nucleotide diphosphorylase [Oscillospiraceae bacterium]|jgi:nicotinate-nucleotide pyrophosphorylase (carboxylating)|nr:carboxylating nicotinate-nucleotide diphosphorylase [Oscillospiraceae bacterium]